MSFPSRFLAACSAGVAATAWTASPAVAYRVFLDADDDGDPTTFRNVVDGPLEVPVTIVVSLDEGDAALTELGFLIEWDCTDDASICWHAAPHGGVGGSLPEDSYPFSDVGMAACTGLGCECFAALYFSASVDTPAVGTWVLATLPFTRLGVGSSCEPLVYPEVEFRVQCSVCDYAPGDDPFTRMLLRGDSPATPAPIEGAIATWGRVKAGYR
jgi:hypothetical protein